MIADGQVVGDGSWELKVLVTDLAVERCLRVKGDLHIGGVMLRLVEDLDIASDWSDHALWWPGKNCWLSRTRSTLDQYGVQADALLHFTPMHKTLRVQLPDLRYLDCRVDFSVKTFNAVVTLCKELGVRHPEELSFAKPLESEDLRYNYREKETSKKKSSVATAIADTNTFIAHQPHGNSTTVRPAVWMPKAPPDALPWCLIRPEARPIIIRRPSVRPPERGGRTRRTRQTGTIRRAFSTPLGRALMGCRLSTFHWP